LRLRSLVVFAVFDPVFGIGAAVVDPPAVEAPRELVGAVDWTPGLRSEISKQGVDAGDEHERAGARGVGVAGEDLVSVSLLLFFFFFFFVFFFEVERVLAPAPVFLVVVVVVVVEIVAVVAVDVVDKVLVDVLVVVVVFGVLLRTKSEKEKREERREKKKRKGFRVRASESEKRAKEERFCSSPLSLSPSLYCSSLLPLPLQATGRPGPRSRRLFVFGVGDVSAVVW